MKLTMKWTLILAVVLLAACTPETPDQAAAKFCDLNGKPDAGVAVKRLISRNLRGLWDTAQKMSDSLAEQTPDKKPPLADGLRIQAYPQKAPVCKLAGPAVVKAKTAEVMIFRGWPKNEQPGWVDRLEYVKENGTWVIDNIKFAPVYQDDLLQYLQGIASGQY